MKISGEMIQREIAGEHILVPVGKTALHLQGMLTLTDSGLLLWNRLQEECKETDLVDAILGEYDVDSETALQDVRSFLGNLRKLGILE